MLCFIFWRMTMQKSLLAASAAFITLCSSTSAIAAPNAEIQALKAEIQSLRQVYEGRIAELESKLSKIESESTVTQQNVIIPAPTATKKAARNIHDNSFNPSIGVILNGRYSAFSEKEAPIAGFAVGEEGTRPQEGLALSESELNFSSNVDDKFYGSVTAALVREEGEDEIELEEAYLQTLPGSGLPTGFTLKAGRALWTLGYLNEHHSHTDDFADRPLPYRVFLNNAYNDDGIEVSYILPTALYSEIGGGLFRGEDYPFGGSQGSKAGAWSVFARMGGDIGETQSWRIGSYLLSGETKGRTSNEETVIVAGDSNLYAADIRYTWAPTGNSNDQEVILQGEYFLRHEKGTYQDSALATVPVTMHDHLNGWYAQATYKFLPQWRAGLRYSQLEAPTTSEIFAGGTLDASGHTPQAIALMADWTNSEFSRLRLQYNREELAENHHDHQLILQYIMSIGAHGAHKY